MLYKKNNEQALSTELFKNPTSEYRGAPFWAWNTVLDKDEVVRQAESFKKMGFGGYHMHSRSGMGSEYLGENFMACVKACDENAKENGMLAWLYDEDRWPSGFAGGYVVEEGKYRQRKLYFTRVPSKETGVFDMDGCLTAGETAVAAYKVRLRFGRLVSYKRLDVKTAKMGIGVFFAVVKVNPDDPWYGNCSYVDTLNKKAIDKFADITLSAYKNAVGEDFGGSVPAIFTDEPQFAKCGTFKSALFPLQVTIPWTDDFDVTFEKANGVKILDKLPELFFESADGKPALTRYRFYDFLTERFAEAFSYNFGKKADEAGVPLTGHLMEEPTLESQTAAVGETMRHYRGFGIPGIDLLCGRHEFTTAKQTQSVARQDGREAMLCELYGVSRWDADFPKFKEEGDWLAATGVTVRVPHLSMMSMAGDAKRDYPVSIFYQSPWFERYKEVEDHFARVNTAMTRGKTVTEIAVIHPIESFWLINGANDICGKAKYKANKSFENITEWLVRNGLDFDFICESILPEQCEKGGFPLKVGKMSYKSIVVPSCITLRSSTLDRLEAFVKEGGKLIFAGDIPKCENAEISGRAKALASNATVIPFEKDAVIKALEGSRYVDFFADGKRTNDFVYKLNEDNGGLWLFVARPSHARNAVIHSDGSVNKEVVTVKVNGEYAVSLWNTADGSVKGAQYRHANGATYADFTVYDNDSLLLRYDTTEIYAPEKVVKYRAKSINSVMDDVPYTLDEPNVLLLDRAHYAVDGGEYSSKQERIILLDHKIKKTLGIKRSRVQPWLISDTTSEHKVKFKFEFSSEIEVLEPEFALEGAEIADIFVNGKKIEKRIAGYYVDKCIKKVALPPIAVGKTVVEVEYPLSEKVFLENCFVLGNFGVRISGSKFKLTALPKTVKFGDISKQGFPFYGGKLTYHTSFKSEGGRVSLCVPEYRSALIDIKTDRDEKAIIYPPFTAVLTAEKGENKVDITAYISRENAFGLTFEPYNYRRLDSPGAYRIKPLTFIKKYFTQKAGVLKTPLASDTEEYV